MRYPLLVQMLGCHLHEDWPILSGTPQKALDAAIAERPLEHRQQARREVQHLLETEEDTQLRSMLNDGLGVNVLFRKPSEARAFAEEIERKLLHAVKMQFNRDRNGNLTR